MTKALNILYLEYQMGQYQFLFMTALLNHDFVHAMYYQFLFLYTKDAHRDEMNSANPSEYRDYCDSWMIACTGKVLDAQAS